MKNIFILTICLFSISLMGQGNQDLKELSRIELGARFNSTGSGFYPQLTFNYYRTENNILHFTGALGIGSHGFAITGEFWNEYRRYIGENKKWYFSHGLTAHSGYSAYDYREFTNVDSKYQIVPVGIGYKIGGGYRINEHFTLNANLNPKISYLFGNQNPNLNRYKVNVPLSLGINYRF